MTKRFKLYTAVFGLGGSLLLISQISTNLATTTKTDFSNHFYSSEQLNRSATDRYINLAQKYLAIKEKDKEVRKFHNEKEYTRGIDKAKLAFPTIHVWVTKAYLGNVATILGITGAIIAFIIGVIALALVAAAVAGIITGGIGFVILPIMGAIYAAATAIVMNNINSYEIGGYFQADYSGIASPFTIIGTLRSQNEFETRRQIVPVHEKVKDSNKESYDFDYFDQTKAKVWIDFDYDAQEEFSGYIDISRYTNQLKYRKINSIIGKLFFEDTRGQEFKIDDNKFQTFIKNYYERTTNDYLFINYVNKEFKVGGYKYKSNKNNENIWLKRKAANVNPIKHIGMYLEIEFEVL